MTKPVDPPSQPGDAPQPPPAADPDGRQHRGEAIRMPGRLVLVVRRRLLGLGGEMPRGLDQTWIIRAERPAPTRRYDFVAIEAERGKARAPPSMAAAQG